MTLKEDIHTLAQEILASYETRTAGLASLRHEVTSQREDAHAYLTNLNRAHQAMAHQQRERLAQAHSTIQRSNGQRRVQTHAVMKALATAHAEARGEWQGLAATLHARRGGTATEATSPPRRSPRRSGRGGGGSQGQGEQGDAGAQ